METNIIDLKHDSTDDVTQNNETIWVCVICLTTSTVSPLDQSALTWLAFIGVTPTAAGVVGVAGVSGGACAGCAGGLRRAGRLARRARAAQEVLREFDGKQLNLKWLSKFNEENPPLVALSTRHLGANHYDYEFDHHGRTTVMLKKEPEVEVKLETRSGSDVSDAEVDDSHFSDSEDVKLIVFSTKNVKTDDLKELKPIEEKGLTDSRKRKLTDSKKTKPADSKLSTKSKKKLSKSKTKLLPEAKRKLTSEALTAAKKSQIETDLKLKEFFEIERLTTEQQREEIAKRKESENYVQSQLKCHLCFKGFTSDKSYESHMMGHSDKMGRFKCPICHLSCVSNSYVGKHVNNQHRYRYTCRVCAAAFKYRTAAKMHINWHQGKKYVCDICGQEFDHQNTCLGHKRIKHPSQEHVCALCGFSFLNQKGVSYHRARKHALDDDTIPADGPECEPCGIRFKSAEALAAHRRVSPRHGECVRNEPGRPAEPSKKHREPISCEQCGKQMSSLRGYSAHFARFHPTSTRTVFPRDARPSLCTVCGKTFKNPKNMQFHARSHSTRWRYECEICHKVFKRKDFKMKHVNIHTNEKKYPCHVCGKTFNHAGNRDRHVLVHSAKDCKCEQCDKCFKSEKEVEIHVKYVHLKMPYPKRSRQRDGKPGRRDMFLDD